MPREVVQPETDVDETTEVSLRRLKWSARLVLALGALFFVVLVGGLSVFFASEGEYGFFESLYFSLITVSTVGYGELPHLQSHPWARVVSACTIVFGLIALSYFQSTLTALFLEGTFSKAFRRRAMNKQIRKLHDHFILVGCGRVGQYVAGEFVRAHLPFVVIEKNPDAVHHLEHEIGEQILYLEGDANDDEVLELAGISSARRLVTTLSLDRDNLFVTLSARTMNPQLRIISKVVNARNEAKLLRAGASSTVSPQHIGGLRLAAAVSTPHVTEFFERILQLPGEIRFHELLVSHQSAEPTSRSRTLACVPMGIFSWWPSVLRMGVTASTQDRRNASNRARISSSWDPPIRLVACVIRSEAGLWVAASALGAPEPR